MTVSLETAEDLRERLALFHYLQPSNSAEERERFMDHVDAGETYNPSYTYTTFSEQERCRQLLDTLDGNATTELEESMVASLAGRLRMIEAIGSDAITQRSREHYGTPGEALVEDARERFETPDPGDGAPVDGELLKEAFDVLFGRLGISYGSKLAPVDIIRNSPQDREILVPENKQYDRMAAKRLLIHESTHSVRTVNGLEAGQPPLIVGTQRYEVAEEGLAAFNEREVDVFEDTLPRIASRVIAVAAADNSFHELFRMMRDLGLDRDLAYTRTYRVKRGLPDTGRPGGFIKDHIYYQGCFDLVETPELADQLYVGKIGFKDLNAVSADPAVTREQHLEAYEEASGVIANT